MACRVGVDVGGTNTDCAVLLSGKVVGTAKRVTTEPVLDGVVAAMLAGLQDAHVEPCAVQGVMLGTTQFVNAAVQRRGLARVAVLRLCGPSTRALPPFCDLPPALRRAVAAHCELLPGGLEYDGATVIAALDEQAVRLGARRALAAGARAIVVSCVFSPVAPGQEEHAAALVRAEVEADGVAVVPSHRIGQLGLLERENAAVLNAALLPLATRVVPACVAAVRRAGVAAPVFFTANDGTLLSAAQAQQMPVATFQSGPVNSLRGAAYLTGLRNAIVIDIGGTTTDVGVLVNGLPRPAPHSVSFAGATTNFSAPDVTSTGLGGGSLVRFTEGRCSVGPDSVGARLHQEAVCAGGSSLTGSDVAVALGRMELGSRAAAEAALRDGRAEQAWRVVQSTLERCVDAAKTQAGDVPAVVVGGGSPLCGDALAGASCVLRPQHAAVANAVGAAIPQVGGSVDVVVQLGPTPASRGEALRRAEAQAVAQAEAAGAVPGSCEVVLREEIPLAYLPGSACRLLVKAVGDLSLQGGAVGSDGPGTPTGAALAAEERPGAARRAGREDEEGQMPASRGTHQGELQPGAAVLGRPDDPTVAQLAAWQPQIDPAGDWLIHEADLHLIAVGCGILGCGGGGSPHKARVKALLELHRRGEEGTVAWRAARCSCAATQPRPVPATRERNHNCSSQLIAARSVGCMRVVSPASLPDDALVVDVGFMGAPTVGIEKLDSNQAEAAAKAALAAFNAADQAAPLDPQSQAGPPHGRQRAVAALLAGEIGGGNGIEPLSVAARLGLPVVDADLMGRAFPELQMMTSAICGIGLTPAAIADEKGNTVAVQSVQSPEWLERLLRPLCTNMGCTAGFSSRPLTGAELKRVAVHHSLSFAWRLGSAVAGAQHNKSDAPAAAAEAGGGRLLFAGKVMDVQRVTTGGFARGSLVLQGLHGGAWAGRQLTILFQNENLVATEGDRVLAVVPDLICCLESQTGLPVATEEVRYGLRLSVACLPAHPLLRSAEALQLVGPAAFGHPEVTYKPLAAYAPPVPIPQPQPTGRLVNEI